MGLLNWEYTTLTIRPLRTPLTPDEDLPELFSIKETASKKLSKVVHATQAHGSMEQKKNLEKLSLLEEKKNEKTKRFIRCQHKCSCKKE